VPSVVSRPLARAAARFRCPICSGPLVSTCGTLRCGRGHSFDVSRHGHVALMPPTRRPVEGDNAAMVAARAAVFDAQSFAPLTAALVRTALDVTRDRAPTVLDVGAGTGHHLAAVLDALPHAQGIAFDASRAALRYAARASGLETTDGTTAPLDERQGESDGWTRHGTTPGRLEVGVPVRAHAPRRVQPRRVG